LLDTLALQAKLLKLEEAKLDTALQREAIRWLEFAA
jgi:hypothetical protein